MIDALDERLPAVLRIYSILPRLASHGIQHKRVLLQSVDIDLETRFAKASFLWEVYDLHLLPAKFAALGIVTGAGGQSMDMTRILVDPETNIALVRRSDYLVPGTAV